jgi:hypothetical protein
MQHSLPSVGALIRVRDVDGSSPAARSFHRRDVRREPLFINVVDGAVAESCQPPPGTHLLIVGVEPTSIDRGRHSFTIYVLYQTRVWMSWYTYDAETFHGDFTVVSDAV